MKIRTRYTLLTTALIGTVVAAIAVTVTRAQRSVLEAQSRERLNALSEGVSRLAQESLEGRDQLMLLSYLMYLQKDHPELGYAGVTRNGHTTKLGEEGSGLLYWARTLQARHPVKYTVTTAASGAPSNADLQVSSAGVTLSMTGSAMVNVDEAPADSLEVRLGFVTKKLDNEISRQLRPMMQQTIAIAGLFMVLGMLGALSAAKTLTAPLMALTAAVTEVKSGNLNVEVHARAEDEVGALAVRFNEMTGRIKELLQGREDILHALSHELNTPLAGLKGYLELWQQRGLPAAGPQREQVLETMTAAVLRMEHSLGSALRHFRSESMAEEQRRVVWINDLFRQVCTLFAPIAGSKRITFEFPPPSVVDCLFTDEELLRQVVTNLISNSLKYTPDGGRIRLSLAGSPQAVRFSVADNGYGIEPGDLPHLFTKFYRSASGEEGRQRIPGTGLGLSIVDKAVRALGGTIAVQSEPGKGSIFTVVIPRSLPKAGTEAS